MKTIVASSFILGAVTGLFFRDELNFPTNMRIKVAILEYNLLTRQRLNTDLLDIVDPNSSREMALKSRELIEAHESD